MAETLSERVAALENALAAAECERDSWRKSWEGADIMRMRLVKQRNAAESREQQAREALTRVAECVRRGYAVPDNPPPVADFRILSREDRAEIADRILDFTDREYPAVPPEREGEPTCAVCKDTRKVFDPTKSVWTWCRACQSHPPQAAPERVTVGNRVVWFDAKNKEFPYRIEFLGSHPCGGEATLAGVFRYLAANQVRGEQHEYAALLALASRPTASGEG